VGAPLHVALLRGINVGGKNRLRMADLVALLEEAGARDARTHLQSGNAVFAASRALAERLPRRLSAALAREHGLTVPVVLRSARELAAVAAHNPFLDEGADPSTLAVAFLAERPARSALAALDPERSPGDRLVARGRELYLHFPNGAARSKLTNAYLDRTLGTTSTVRNWRTVRALADLVGGA